MKYGYRLSFSVSILAVFTFLALAKGPNISWPTSAPTRLVLVGPNEPGQRMILRGRVVLADGRSPEARAMVYAYHTDNSGLYHPASEPENAMPRLRGFVQTDADGHYEFETIKPAPYPGGGVPAHVHMAVKPQQGTTVYDTVFFEGDRYLTQADRSKYTKPGDFTDICVLHSEKNGVQLCTHDIKLAE